MPDMQDRRHGRLVDVIVFETGASLGARATYVDTNSKNSQRLMSWLDVDNPAIESS